MRMSQWGAKRDPIAQRIQRGTRVSLSRLPSVDQARTAMALGRCQLVSRFPLGRLGPQCFTFQMQRHQFVDRRRSIAAPELGEEFVNFEREGKCQWNAAAVRKLWPRSNRLIIHLT